MIYHTAPTACIPNFCRSLLEIGPSPPPDMTPLPPSSSPGHVRFKYFLLLSFAAIATIIFGMTSAPLSFAFLLISCSDHAVFKTSFSKNPPRTTFRNFNKINISFLCRRQLVNKRSFLCSHLYDRGTRHALEECPSIWKVCCFT